MHRLNCRWLEDRHIGAGQAHPVFDIRADLLVAEPGSATFDDDSPGQRFVHRHPGPAAQLGEPDQQQAEPVPGSNAVVGDYLELGENIVAEMARFVEDQHR